MRYFFAACAALLLAACGDSSTGPDVVPAELAGDWVAYPGCLPNCGFTLTPIDAPADSFNIIAAMGITMELNLTRTGRIEVVALNAGTVEPITGTVTVEGQTLILRDNTGAVDTVDYQLLSSPTRLHVAFRKLVTLDGAPSTVRGAFVRR
jgi:hypothetical protein